MKNIYIICMEIYGYFQGFTKNEENQISLTNLKENAAIYDDIGSAENVKTEILSIIEKPASRYKKVL